MDKRREMTDEELASIVPGMRLRDIPGHLYHVVAVTNWTHKGRDEGDVATLAYWVKGWQCWKFIAVSSEEMRILYRIDK